MTTSSNLVCITLAAGADLSTKQFLFVDMASDGQIDPVASAGGRGIGVLQDKPDAAGKAACVAVAGVSMVVAGGNVTVGHNVQSDNAGKAITAASGDYILGIALATGVSGDVIPVLLGSNHLLA